MKKFLLAISASLIASPTFASCWAVIKTSAPVSVDITPEKSTETFVDVNPDVVGNQTVTIKCAGFIHQQTGAESASCYDDAGDLAIWLIMPDPVNANRAVGFMTVVPTFRPGSRIRTLPFEFARCTKA
jgi:hypothetical protein